MGMSYFLVQKHTHVIKVSWFFVHLPFVLAPWGFARLCEAFGGFGGFCEAMGSFDRRGEALRGLGRFYRLWKALSCFGRFWLWKALGSF